MTPLVILCIRDLKIEIITVLAIMAGVGTGIQVTRLHITMLPVLMPMIHSVIHHLATVQTLPPHLKPRVVQWGIHTQGLRIVRVGKWSALVMSTRHMLLTVLAKNDLLVHTVLAHTLLQS
jgi:hypothetical protein